MAANVADLHRDHLQWRNENAFWHDQLREWETEAAQAVLELRDVEKSLLDHKRALETHAAALRLYQTETDQHEHELADACRKADLSGMPCACSGHESDTENHNKQRQVHEALKRDHHRFMARWSLLLKAMRAG